MCCDMDMVEGHRNCDEPVFEAQQVDNLGHKVSASNHQFHGLNAHSGLLSRQDHSLWSEAHLHLSPFLHCHHIGQERADAL